MEHEEEKERWIPWEQRIKDPTICSFCGKPVVPGYKVCEKTFGDVQKEYEVSKMQEWIKELKRREHRRFEAMNAYKQAKHIDGNGNMGAKCMNGKSGA